MELRAGGKRRSPTPGGVVAAQMFSAAADRSIPGPAEGNLYIADCMAMGNRAGQLVLVAGPLRGDHFSRGERVVNETHIG